MRFEVNGAGWKHEFESTEGMVGRFLEERAIYLMILAQRQVGVDTGALRESIHWTLSSDALGLVATVGSDDRVALLHHEGTVPHVIVPREKRTLRFAQNGKIVYAKIVHHPGTKPNRYLTDNLPKIFDKTT